MGKSGCYNNIRGNKKAGRNEWHYGGCNVRDNLLITNTTTKRVCLMLDKIAGWWWSYRQSGGAQLSTRNAAATN